MRDSDWLITWKPGTGSARVLLAVGDAMDFEIRIPKQKLATAGKSDFSIKATMIARGNASRRVEFTRRVEHANGAESWIACLEAIAADPWGLKDVLRIQPRFGTVRNYTAALLSSRHRPAFDDGIIESVHSYVFRVTPL